MVAVKLTNGELASIVEAASYLRGIAAAWPDGPYRRWSDDLHNIAAAHAVEAMSVPAPAGVTRTRIRPGQRVVMEDGREANVLALWSDGAGADCDLVFDNGSQCRSHTSRLRPVVEPDSRHWRLHAHGLTEV